MHSIIDDFVWIAIGLAVVAFLFMLGAAYIFLDEGIRRLIRSSRKPAGATIPNLDSQTIRSNSARLANTGIPSQMPGYKGAPLIKPHSRRRPTLWQTVRGKVKSVGHLHLHLGHHKPANAKS